MSRSQSPWSPKSHNLSGDHKAIFMSDTKTTHSLRTHMLYLEWAGCVHLSWTPSFITITQPWPISYLCWKLQLLYNSQILIWSDGEAQEMLERFKSILNITSDVTAKDNQYLLTHLLVEVNFVPSIREVLQKRIPSSRRSFFLDEFGVVLWTITRSKTSCGQLPSSTTTWRPKKIRWCKLRPPLHRWVKTSLEWFRFAAQTIPTKLWQTLQVDSGRQAPWST